MIFNLATAHLGDVLMAMPAMRAGDCVIARPEHRVPGLDVNWFDVGAGIIAPADPLVHSTDSWLAKTGRTPIRHELMPELDRTITVVAPDVAAPGRAWGLWRELEEAMPLATYLNRLCPRRLWMRALRRAHTVICPDTGTAHMADALGVPRVIALHGDRRNWIRCAPYWSRAHCVVRESMAAITLNDVLEAARG